MTAVRLTSNVWLVGTADQSSPAFTSIYDCNQYLIWDGQRGVLVDAGTGLGAEDWTANVSTVADVDSIEALFLTHYHGDHAGGAAAAGEKGWSIAADIVTANALSNGDETVTQVKRARERGIYPSDFSLHPQSVDWVLDDGDSIQLSGLSFTSIQAPGHCDGHVVFLLEDSEGIRALFTGDVLFADGLVSMQAIPDCRLDLYAESVIRIGTLGIEQLFPGHGRPVLKGANADVARAAESFSRLVPPRNALNP